MFRFVSEPTSISFTVDEVLGHLMSTIQAVLPVRLNSRFLLQQQIEEKKILSGKHNFEQQFETGTSMVEKKFRDFQWDFSFQIGSTSCAPDGCFIDRLGCSSPGKINRKSMVISNKKMAYQRVGTISSKASPPNISQESKLYFSSHTNVHHSGFDIFEKNGENQELENDYTVKRDLGDVNFETNHDYCGVPTQLT